MNKKVFGIFVSLFAVAMLAMPMSVVSSTNPETKTLTGTLYVYGTPESVIHAGVSGNTLLKFRDATPLTFTGEISGSGTYNGNWLIKDGTFHLIVGEYVLEDVTINDVDGTGLVGTGDLVIGHNWYDLWIKTGSGELQSIRGRGTLTSAGFNKYNYELEIKINP